MAGGGGVEDGHAWAFVGAQGEFAGQDQVEQTLPRGIGTSHADSRFLASYSSRRI